MASTPRQGLSACGLSQGGGSGRALRPSDGPGAGRDPGGARVSGVLGVEGRESGGGFRDRHTTTHRARPRPLSPFGLPAPAQHTLTRPRPPRASATHCSLDGQGRKWIAATARGLLPALARSIIRSLECPLICCLSCPSPSAPSSPPSAQRNLPVAVRPAVRRQSCFRPGCGWRGCVCGRGCPAGREIKGMGQGKGKPAEWCAADWGTVWQAGESKRATARPITFPLRQSYTEENHPPSQTFQRGR